MKPIVRTFVALFSLWLILATSAGAMFMRMDPDTPLEDILQSVEKKVKDNPKDAHALYLLGRVHSLAWASGGNQVKLSREKDGMPSFSHDATVRVSRDDLNKTASAESIKHLNDSIASYRKAIELEPKNGLYHLGLAWMMEQQLSVPPPTTMNADKSLPAVDRKAAIKAVIDEYVTAFDLRLKEDKSKEDRLMGGDTFVSMEAAEDAIRLLQTIDPVDNALVKRLEDGKAAVMAKGMAITPIVVALIDGAKLSDLIDPALSVKFDLAGFGPGHRWPWINQKAGLLVWDPAGTGQITSGRQLFGTMTWQMLFRDGYEAMSMLDRNHDGTLSGDELKPIALWRDANSNGVSDVGEVATLEKAGITAIELTATNNSAGVLQINAGIHWRDGHSTASFDWVPVSK